MSYLDEIEGKVKEGVYLKKYIRNSFNICVSFNGLNFNCKVLEEKIYNVENELIFIIDQEIDKDSNYHYFSIYNVNEGNEIISYSLNKKNYLLSAS